MNFENLYQIDIPGRFSGTVEVSEGSIELEFPTATMNAMIKRYNLHLLTPERKNIEFDLLRFGSGEWCDEPYIQLQPELAINAEVRIAAKKEIDKMKI